jgi:hypothetical protein
MSGRAIVLASVLAISIATPTFARGGGGGDSRWGRGTQITTPVKRADLEGQIKDRFAKADANRDGFLVQTEMDAARTAMVAEWRSQHFTTLDTNKDGSISRAEFDARLAARAAQSSATTLGVGRGAGTVGMGRGGLLTRADANSDGKVSLAEALATPLARFDAADANKDGTLTPEERTAARATLGGGGRRSGRGWRG